MKRICVFCGASEGGRPAYAEAARRLGGELVARGLGLVYGGCAVGLMGVLADTVLHHGGEVIGVIPEPLVARELAHSGLTELRVVGSMHERKATMASLVDGFVALPGGLGTLDETFEALTWAQLGIHGKPVGVLNVEGYWDGLRRVMDHAVQERFVRPEYAALLLFADTPADLLDRFAAWRAPDLQPTWVDSNRT
ncbi:MAG TPA: TIGR00730 family Rossman fold protein [Candidatus Binatia bacterium]|nr:TIGR00730 family Rossman fold protein [Candidatus Binatia bacterium]